MFDQYAVNLPYPEITGEITSRELAVLYDLYAGRFSEMTAVTTYAYQHAISHGDSALAELVGGISITEMRHIELLAAAIVAFGKDPVFAGRYNFFSCSYTNYQKDPVAFLSDNIDAENYAVQEYTKAAENSTNQSLAELYARIAMDEQLHITLLSDCLQSYTKHREEENYEE